MNMTTVRACLTHSSPTIPHFEPIPPKSKSAALLHSPTEKPAQGIASRRHMALLVSIGALIPTIQHPPPPAFAFDVGISGPKDWLKEQKKKSVKFLLAPIDASREILRSAYQLLSAEDSRYEQKDLEEIQGLLRSAARDCVPEERNSFVAFQSRTGVEVCTFKLIVKNASSLLDDNDPTKVEAEAMLSDLIRSFTFLIGVAKEANIQLISDRHKVADALMDTLSSLHKFEQGIKGCIEV